MHDPPGVGAHARRTRRSCVAAELVRDGKADAMVERRQHRRHDGRRAAAHRPHPRRRPPRDRGADPRARSRAADPRRRRRHRRLHRRVAACSSRSWAASTPGCASASTSRRVGLLSNGEEPGKGDELRKQTSTPLLESMPWFVGNVEGRDFMHDTVDVIVTDGFTGNVALKTVEGAHPRHRPASSSTTLGRRPRLRRRPRSSCRCCSGRRRLARPRHDRRLRAARGRRRVRDLARVVERTGDRQRGRRRGAGECVEGRIVERIEEAAVADAG